MISHRLDVLSAHIHTGNIFLKTHLNNDCNVTLKDLTGGPASRAYAIQRQQTKDIYLCTHIWGLEISRTNYHHHQPGDYPFLILTEGFFFSPSSFLPFSKITLWREEQATNFSL